MPSRIMRNILMVAALLGLSAPGAGQSQAPEPNEPLALVKSFWRQEVKGKRLTEQGWYDLGGLFLDPPTFPGLLFPGPMAVHVISQGGAVH